MLIFHTALRVEAQPFIDLLGLKKDLSWNTHEVYQKDDCLVLVGGMGKLRSAVALSALLSKYYYSPGFDVQSLLVVNVGIAAGHDEKGSCFRITKVFDEGTQRRYYPDYFLSSPFKDAFLCTVDKAVQDGGKTYQDLVDMEASGVLEAARPFCGTHQVQCFKVISDAYSSQGLSLNDIPELIMPQREAILSFARESQHYHKTFSFALSQEEIDVLNQLIDRHRFSESQSRMLHSWALSFKARGGTLCASHIPQELLEVTQNKQERSNAFEYLRSVFYSA